MSILKSQRTQVLLVVFAFFIITIALPVYAKGPKHTGPPIINKTVSDEPVIWAVPPCDRLYGYDHKVQITLLSQNNIVKLWYDEKGELEFVNGKIKERVQLNALYQDGSLGEPVMLELNFAFTNDLSGVNTMSGIRSAIVNPGGGLEIVNNGHLKMVPDPGFTNTRGDVLTESGSWDAVEGDRFDHIKFACELVSE